MQQQPPTFQQVLNECSHSLPYIENFDRDCDTMLQLQNVPMMLQNRDQLKGADKLAIEMFIDYTIYFAYQKIIHRMFGQPDE